MPWSIPRPETRWPTASWSASARSKVPDHEAALRVVFDRLTEPDGLVAVGHRIVHGGKTFYQPTVITDEVIKKLEELSPLAPLHNPPGVLGIQVARNVLPDLPHVAVFDTAFFHDLPQAAATYAIDREVSERWDVRRYGFHGTSHRYVSEQAAVFLGQQLESLSQIVLHLGNGASAAAILGGRPGGHVDGPDAAGGPGDGHPRRVTSTRASSSICAARP